MGAHGFDVLADPIGQFIVLQLVASFSFHA
jgi:hypothetical protein